MTAYYNEHDPYAAQWLRNLIAAGHIAPGEVDERSILDVSSDDLIGFTQCHFFAGIGIWSFALRRAGWADDRPIWTGSCPCQPFSAAGGRKGFEDERHLWPAWFRLLAGRRPAVVVGEQVASKDGLSWLDLVSADLETSGYAFAAADLCAAGYGAAHIRQRLYFVGLGDPKRAGFPQQFGVGGIPSSSSSSSSRQGFGRGSPSTCGVADTDGGQSGQAGEIQSSGEHGREPQNGGALRCGDSRTRSRSTGELGWPGAPDRIGGAIDWLRCRDERWRPVEAGTFPLAYAAPARMGRLRAYGNGLDAETATGFVEAVMEVI